MLNIIIQFLKRFFQFSTPAKSIDTEHIKIQTPQQGISYSEHLIPTLQHEHQELVNLYGKINYFLNTHDFKEIDQILGTLKTEFSQHIMQENVSFYCYLEQQCSNDPQQMETIRNYRKEMNGISHAFLKFIKKWQNTVINTETLSEFRNEYDSIGSVLARRINSEEDHLYPMYQPKPIN